MAAFGDWASSYYEAGYSVLPVWLDTKACRVKDWSKIFSHDLPPDETIELMMNKHHDKGIGIACGRASNIIAVDFDYHKNPDAVEIENIILGILPPSPVAKKGSKGWTKFYKYNERIRNRGIRRSFMEDEQMVDILSTGKLTVLPPTAHENGEVAYHWLTPETLLDIDSSELPEITIEHINQLDEVAKLNNNDLRELTKPSEPVRHNQIFGFILRNSEIADNMSQLIRDVLAFDDEVLGKHSKGAYFRDKKYSKDGREADCTKFVTRVCEWKKNKKSQDGLKWEVGKHSKDYRKGKKPSTDYYDFRDFLESKWKDVRFCPITRTAYFRDPQNDNEWGPIDNLREAIGSYVNDVGLAKSFVNAHLSRYIAELEPKLLVDIPRWDKVDRLGQMFSMLKVKNVSATHADELLKEWASLVLARLDNTEIQNRFLVFKGSQGLGKDHFIQHLFKGLDTYFAYLDMESDSKEVKKIVCDVLVAAIPEFDDSNKLALSQLKSLITSPHSNFRDSYARKATRHKMQATFVSSMNFDYILRDYSGNRRFLVIELDKITWEYSRIDKIQLIAQMEYLKNHKYKASAAAHAEMDKYIKSKTPDNVEELFLEVIGDMIATRENNKYDPINKHGYLVRWPDISSEVKKFANEHQIGIRRAQTLIKNKYQKHNGECKYYTTRHLESVNLSKGGIGTVLDDSRHGVSG